MFACACGSILARRGDIFWQEAERQKVMCNLDFPLEFLDQLLLVSRGRAMRDSFLRD